MKLTTILKSIRRRWYIALGGLLATAVLCLLAYNHTSPSYQRSASELLVPGSQTVPKGGNPFLYLGGLDQASDVLVQALDANDIQGPLGDTYPDTTVTIARDVSSTGPIIVVTVEGQNESAVRGAFARMLDVGPTTLESLQVQAAVPSAARITMLPIDIDTTSTINNKSRVQVAGLVGAAGIVGTILLIALVDGLVLARRRRISRRAALEEKKLLARPRTLSTSERLTPGRVVRAARRGPRRATKPRKPAQK
jgi:hypothetical protein